MQKRIWLLTASSVISLLSLFTLSFWLSPQTQAAQILTTFADPLGGQAISGQDRSLLGVGTLYITRTIEVDPIDDNNPGGGCTLREAIDVANAGLGAGTAPNQCTVTESGASPPVAYEINLPDYTYTLSGSAGEDGNVGGDLDILGSMNINGSTSTIIDGAGIDRVFHIPISEIDLTLTVSSLTVQNGRAYDGGGLYNNGGTVNIIASTLTNNDAEHHGGGIFDTLGMVMISHSTISDNQAGDLGGGLYQGAGSTVAISDSLIAANLSEGSGGGISINAYNGITLHIFNSTIRDNTALNLDTLYRYGGGESALQGTTL